MQQATISKTFDSYDHYTETYYASSNAVAASAERIYLFIKEYITYLSDEEKEAIFPEKYKKKDDSYPRPVLRVDGFVSDGNLRSLRLSSS